MLLLQILTDLWKIMEKIAHFGTFLSEATGGLKNLLTIMEKELEFAEGMDM